MMAVAPTVTPLTVVGGFLGAGKTTFLNHLLRAGGARYAVLVNDFGAVNIDAGLIARHDGTTMTLTNGCVCCSIGGGFFETLGSILDAPTAFDHIVIEASGVGDPWRIAEIALVEPALRLNAVIVIADASRIEGLLRDARVGDTVRQQFDRCDLVLLNKIDLADAATISAARAALVALRDGLRIVETSERDMPELPLAISTPRSRFQAEAVADSADHERDFRRWHYRRDGQFNRARLTAALTELPPSLLRLKGECRFVGEDKEVLLQMVGQDWSLAESTSEAPSETCGITLVGVGTADLPASAELDRILDRALA